MVSKRGRSDRYNLNGEFEAIKSELDSSQKTQVQRDGTARQSGLLWRVKHSSTSGNAD